MVVFSVVLMILAEGGWMDIGRFDTAHGAPHQDVLGKRGGVLYKNWLDDLSFRNAYHFAIETFKNDHERIRNDYFAN